MFPSISGTGLPIGGCCLQHSYNHTFYVSFSRALYSDTSKKEWIVDYGYSHHMAKDGSFLSSFSEAKEGKTFVENGYALTITSSGRVDCENGVIIIIYHVPNLNANTFFLPYLIETRKNIEF
jgi:hypothetical protein